MEFLGKCCVGESRSVVDGLASRFIQSWVNPPSEVPRFAIKPISPAGVGLFQQPMNTLLLSKIQLFGQIAIFPLCESYLQCPTVQWAAIEAHWDGIGAVGRPEC